MITKKEILLNFEEDDKLLVLNLYEKFRISLDRDIPMFGSEFYPPNIWRFFEEKIKIQGFNIKSYGGFSDAERRMISFNNNYDIPYPMGIIKIEKKSKFNEVSHRDYLGALLALGIKRSKFGDLISLKDCAYVTLAEDIEDYVVGNLKQIGKSPCIITKVIEETYIPSVQFKEEVILVQALRIDSIVSKIGKMSRSNAQKIIEEGRVLIDYNKVEDKSIVVKEDERITIRGIGKFILGNIIGNSKSGKYKVIIKKYT